MGFLVSEIRDQKWLEKEVEISKFLKDNKISENALIYEVHFSKSVFKEETEVREYLKSKWLSTESINDEDKTFVAKTMNTSQLDLASAVTVEIRRGVTVLAADLILFPSETYNFNEIGTIFSGCELGQIDLSEKQKGVPTVIEIAKVMSGTHPTYGEINITKEHLESFVKNFSAKVTSTDLAINEDHKKNEAFAWYKDVFLSEDGNTLYGSVAWNENGVDALRKKKYRYFSPEFRFNYVHPHTGKEHGPTLLGGALTNYPFLKMEAIVELNEKQKANVTQPTKEKKMPTIELKDHEAAVVELNGKIKATEDKVVELNAKVQTLEKENSSLKAAAEKAAKESANQKLFDAGKINKAQLVALNEGKSMLEVLSLNEQMNTKANGGEGSNNTVELSEGDKAMAKTLGLTDEEYKAANNIK